MNALPVSQAPAGLARKSVLPSLAPWLDAVQPNDRIPPERAALIPKARAEIRELLEPPTEEQIAVETARLLAWARAMGLPERGLDAAAEAYLEDLRTIPADLLGQAIRSARAAHRFGNRLPLAAEIRAQVQDEIDRRYRLKARLETAARCRVTEPEPPAALTPEQRAELDRIVAEAKARFLTW